MKRPCCQFTVASAATRASPTILSAVQALHNFVSPSGGGGIADPPPQLHDYDYGVALLDMRL